MRSLIRPRAGRAAVVGVVSGLCLRFAGTSASARSSTAPPVVQANPNMVAGGTLHDGVLTLTLEARSSLWYLDGPRQPAMTIEAFSEPGKPPLMPGPLVRVPAGTEMHLTIRNSLSMPLTLFMPTALRAAADRGDVNDSVLIPPGTVRTLMTRAEVPGNYVYHGETPLRSGKANPLGSGLLGGAIVVDTAGPVAPPQDRVFVIMTTRDSAEAACIDTASGNNPTLNAIGCGGERLHYTINGASWPGTERQHATVGDSLHWRVINASGGLPHPMHLHASTRMSMMCASSWLGSRAHSSSATAVRPRARTTCSFSGTGSRKGTPAGDQRADGPGHGRTARRPHCTTPINEPHDECPDAVVLSHGTSGQRRSDRERHDARPMAARGQGRFQPAGEGADPPTRRADRRHGRDLGRRVRA
jgi:hypothetical protein